MQSQMCVCNLDSADVLTGDPQTRTDEKISSVAHPLSEPVLLIHFSHNKHTPGKRYLCAFLFPLLFNPSKTLRAGSIHQVLDVRQQSRERDVCLAHDVFDVQSRRWFQQVRCVEIETGDAVAFGVFQCDVGDSNGEARSDEDENIGSAQQSLHLVELVKIVRMVSLVEQERLRGHRTGAAGTQRRLLQLPRRLVRESPGNARRPQLGRTQTFRQLVFAGDFGPSRLGFSNCGRGTFSQSCAPVVDLESRR